jgi:hypothetical protein
MKKVFAALFGVIPVCAVAEFDQQSLMMCLNTKIEYNLPAAECVTEALQACLQIDDKHVNTKTDCFLTAKSEFATLNAGRIEELQSALDAQKYQIVEISTRYDILGNLMQCDRLHEMNLVMQEDANAINLQNFRCQATAMGMAFAKLYVQSQGLGR